ncbi:MAG: hypothetical protein WC263_03990 [Candidatus Micrarchaeia archaeon]|jgi:hypothetical protein
MTDSDWMNDRSESFKGIVAGRNEAMLYSYFFNQGRSGYAMINAMHECVKEGWGEGLKMLVAANGNSAMHCYLDAIILRELEGAMAQVKIVKEAVAMIGSEARSAEEMHALLVGKKTSVLLQRLILDRCIEAGWAEPLALLIERTRTIYHDHRNGLPSDCTYYSVHEKATEGLKAIALRLRALDEKGKVAEVVRQNPAARAAAQPTPQARRIG